MREHVREQSGRGLGALQWLLSQSGLSLEAQAKPKPELTLIVTFAT